MVTLTLILVAAIGGAVGMFLIARRNPKTVASISSVSNLKTVAEKVISQGVADVVKAASKP